MRSETRDLRHETRDVRRKTRDTRQEIILTYFVSRLTSLVSCLSSRISHLSSHVSRLASQIMLHNNIIAVFILAMFTFSAIAQPQKRPTKKELDIQAIFIDANKSKMLGNINLAIERFEAVLKQDKKNHVAMYELSELYILKKDDDKALRYIKSALDLAPDNTYYNSLYADILVHRSDFGGASKIYDRLIKNDPENENLYYEQAYLYAKADRYDESIRIYNMLESKTGIIPEISKQKYDLYMRADQKKKALEELQKLAGIEPDNIPSQLLLAQHHERMGTKEKASKIYKKILEREPKNPDATLALANLYQTQGETNQYLRSMRPVFGNPDVGIDLKIKEIVPYIKEVSESKDAALQAEAINLTQLLTETHPDEAKAFSVHGDMLNYCDKPLEALPQYERAVALESNAFVVWEQIFFINSALNQPKELLKNTETALELFPAQPTIYFFNGLALTQLNRHREALDILEEALMMTGRNPTLKEQVLIQIGVNYGYLGKPEKSDGAFEEALSLNDKSPLALNNYAYHLALRGEDMKRAEKMVQQALEESPNDPSIQDTYGWMLYKKGKYKEAQKWIKKALDNGAANNPSVLENYGNVLFQLNDPDEALKYWELAREKGANSELLDKKIADRKLYE